MVTVPTLTDGAVTLRGHRDADIDACLEQSTDPLSQRWTRVPIPYSRDDARRFVRDAMPGGWATDLEWGFAVEATDDDGTVRYAGTVSLRNEGDGRAEIAYGAHPWARGRGIIERALRLLLDWGFAERELETVMWHAQVGNWSSRKLAWRLGFSCDGVMHRWMMQRDDLVDAWFGTLGRSDERAPRNPWLDVPRIEGERVRLRAHRDEDVVRIQEACADEQTAYWLGGLPQPYTLASAEQFLTTRTEQHAVGSALHWILADPESDDLLGAVSLMDLDAQSGPEIGYWAHPAARGRGAMSEAVAMVARHAFIAVEDGGLGLCKVRLVSAVDNTASRTVAVRAGFREVGTERNGTKCRDGAHDAVIYDLLATDLAAGRA